MIVISDTTAISTLLQIGELDILKNQFSEIYIPKAVFEELLRLADFNIDISPIQNETCLIIKNPSPSPLLTLLMDTLDSGEAHAIALAQN